MKLALIDLLGSGEVYVFFGFLIVVHLLICAATHYSLISMIFDGA